MGPLRHVGLTALSLLALAGTAQAQTEASGPSAEATSSVVARTDVPANTASTGLEDVVVTARRQVERLQDVPVQADVISPEQIQRYDLTSIEKIAAQTPDLNVGRASNGAGADISLRGIGTSSTSIGVEQSVATIVDGVYYGFGRVIDEGFLDLGRVELLEGPQSLFFGKNATAGVLSFTSNDPTNTPEYRVKASYEFGSQDLLGEVIASGPVTDDLSLRLALRGSNMFGGYYKNEASTQPYNTLDVATGHSLPTLYAAPAARDEPGTDQFIGRLTAKYRPDDRLTVTLKISGNQQDFNNSSWNYVIADCVGGVSTLNRAVACGRDFVTHQNNPPPQVAADLPYSDGTNLYNSYSSVSGTGLVEYAFDQVRLSSLTNYQWNADGWLCACDFQSSVTPTWATEYSTWRAFSEEARAQTTFDFPVNALFGFYYQRTKRNFNQYIVTGNLANSAAPAESYLATTKESATNGQTASPYFQVTWTIVPELELAGGARYTDEWKHSYFTQPYNNPALTSIFIPESGTPGHPGVIHADQTFSNWSPQATLTYRPSREITAYVAYKTGYKSGGFSNSGINSGLGTAADLSFRPEIARGYELGIKTDLLNNHLRVNGTLFDYRYDNLQVDFFNSPTFDFITTNAGSARTRGAEVNGQWAVEDVPGLTLNGTVDFNDAYYSYFVSPCFAGETPAQGCDPATLRQILKGTPLAIAPKWTGLVGAVYQSQIASFDIEASVDARYSDSYLASAFANPYSRQSGYVVADASIRATAQGGHWSAALIGKNLSNRFYYTGVVDGPSTGGGTATSHGVHADQAVFGNIPRTVTLELSYAF